MLLTIHNLPSSTRYADVKSLLKDKCGLTEVIVDNLVNEGKSKKVTVGLATEDDGAFVVRKLNGLFINGQQLYIEDKRRPTADQPYRPSGLDPVQPDTMMQPVMAPVVPSWNQTVSMPYMQPMPVDQKVASSGHNSSNNGNAAGTSLIIKTIIKEDPNSPSTNVRIKTEPLSSSSEQANTNETVTRGSNIKYEPADTSLINNLGTVEEDSITSLTNVRIKTEPLSSDPEKPNTNITNESVTRENDINIINPVIKTEPSDLHQNVLESMLYPASSGLSGANINPKPIITPNDDYIPITHTSPKIEPNDSLVPTRSYKWVSKDKAIPLKSKKRKKQIKLKIPFKLIWNYVKLWRCVSQEISWI